MSIDLTVLPLNRLEKGSVITAQQVEDATGVSRHTRGYDLAILKLAEKVDAYLRGERGLCATIVSERDCLRLLTDPEASAYQAAAFRQSMRRMARADRRLREVDEAALSSREREAHDQAARAQGVILAAQRRARRRLWAGSASD